MEVVDVDTALFIQTSVEIPEFVLITDSQSEELDTVNSDNQDEEDNVLQELIEEGLYQLGFTADGVSQVYLNLSLKGKNLDDVQFLETYNHIQVLDVSDNHLTDLEALKYLPYLISLNASHNQLSSIISSTPPIGLREVNYSYNQLEEIGDLSCHSLLCTLLVDSNFIDEINGIEQCYTLKNVSVSHNKLTRISGLDGLPVKQLDLSNNYIRKIENLKSLKNLQYINLGYNSIRSLRGLQGHELLEDINLRYNQIIDISEIRYLRGLKMLRILNLDGNPIQEINDYRLSILYRIPALMELDVTPVACEEKVLAVNLFKPGLKLTSAADHMENLMKSHMKQTTLLESTLPTKDPYPMLIIIGPIGLWKKLLAQKIAEEFPNTFGICVGYTTRRESTECEKDGVTYRFVNKDEFESMKGRGEFLQTCTLFGNSFGITKHSIEEIAAQKLACVLTMELEGILTLKKTHFKPRCILVVPQDIPKYTERLRNSNRYTESEIFESAQKVETYTEVNQIHPGFFDAAIMDDSFEKIYLELKNIVEAFLDITPPNSARISSGFSDLKCTSRQRLDSVDTAIPLSSFSLIGCKEDVVQPDAVSRAVMESYERRYNRTKAALMGVTSSFKEQLDKIKTPLSSAPIPFVKGYEDLLKSCTLSEDTASIISLCNDEPIPGHIAHDARLTSELTTDTVLKYQDLDELDLEECVTR